MRSLWLHYVLALVIMLSLQSHYVLARCRVCCIMLSLFCCIMCSLFCRIMLSLLGRIMCSLSVSCGRIMCSLSIDLLHYALAPWPHYVLALSLVWPHYVLAQSRSVALFLALLPYYALAQSRSVALFARSFVALCARSVSCVFLELAALCSIMSPHNRPALQNALLS